MKRQVITIFGGSGFIGRYVVQKLVKSGAQLRIAVRNPDAAKFLKPCGQVGQVLPIRVDTRNKKSVRAAIDDSDVVINLIGILAETGKQTFQSVHVDTANYIAQVAKEQGVSQFIHISALNAAPKSHSKYAASKGLAEKKIKTQFPNATILRPSVVFGPEDHFLNLFAELARYSPVLPLIGGGRTKLQPVYVSDVAETIYQLILLDCQSRPNPYSGKIIELVGPKIYSWKQIWQFVLKETDRKRLLLPLPYVCARAVGSILQFLPNPIITPDQVKLIAQDNIATGKHSTLSDLDIAPTSMEALAPSYLRRYRYYG